MKFFVMWGPHLPHIYHHRAHRWFYIATPIAAFVWFAP